MDDETRSSGGGSSMPWAQIGSTLGHSAQYFIGRKKRARASRELQARQAEANALYRQLYGETQQDYSPYMQGGQSALQALLRSYGLGTDQGGKPDYSAFESSPDYQFALQQGQNALDRSAASRGRLYSGGQMQASQRFGQGLATQNLGNYRGGLGNIAGQGLNATNSLVNYRQGFGNQLGAGIMNMGNIRAAESLGEAAGHANWVSSMDDTWGVGGGQQPQRPTQQPQQRGNALMPSGDYNLNGNQMYRNDQGLSYNYPGSY